MTKLTQEQHQKAVHLLANQATLDAIVDELAAHYDQSQAISRNMQESSGLLEALVEAGLILEDLT